jgi:hypothetical protein
MVELDAAVQPEMMEEREQQVEMEQLAPQVEMGRLEITEQPGIPVGVAPRATRGEMEPQE